MKFKARRTPLVAASILAASVIFAGAVFAASGGTSNLPPKGSTNKGVSGRVTTPRPVRSGKFTYKHTRTGYISVSPSDFQSDGVAGAYFNIWTDDVLDGDGCYNAGVNLPHKAKIRWVDFYYTSGPGSDFYGQAVRQAMFDSSGESLGSTFPVDDSNTTSITSVQVAAAQQKVDNFVYAYMVGACISDDTVFHGARIEYTYKNAGD